MTSRAPLPPSAASSLGIALVLSSPTPLLLLDRDLQVHAASSSFCRAFSLALAATVGSSLFDLGGGEWNVPELRSLLESTAAEGTRVDAYEMDLVRPGQGIRNLVLSAHVLDLPASERRCVVLAIFDATEARAAERLKNELIRDKELLLQEQQHRVANSLQIIASILMQSARSVQSEESRSHLRNAHDRVMSIATLQRQLALSTSSEVAIGPYFTDLCHSIAASMIGDPDVIRLTVHVDATVTSADVSVSLGLIVTELVINCLKHAFPENRAGGAIAVEFRSAAAGWTLTVSDNGVGISGGPAPVKAGLGTGIVSALAGKLQAQVHMSDNRPGTTVTVINAGGRDTSGAFGTEQAAR